jgi:CSLREA domain-containing protein
LSQRSIRRAQQRALASKRRRDALRRRRATLAAGAAIGATALFAPAAAQAFEVNSLADAAPDACDSDCTLRDAVTLANSTSGDDSVTFAPGLTGTIRLTQGELPVNATDALTIDGPGASVLTVSGDADSSGTANSGDSRIFNLSGTGAFTVSGLTLSGGYMGSGSGGAVTTSANTDLTIDHTTISGSKASSKGGAIYALGAADVTDSTLSGNSAADGGAIFTNRALTVSGSTLSGNTAATVQGGAIDATGKYAQLDVSDSTISGNSSVLGGGAVLEAATGKYRNGLRSSITNTTISGNHASGNGGGFYVRSTLDGDRVVVSHSAITGNDAGAGAFGGGLQFGPQAPNSGQSGDFDLVDSTVSGNTAGSGAGASFGTAGGSPLVGSTGSVAFDNSTVANNQAATAHGGGLYLPVYLSDQSATIPLTSTIVADNTAAGTPQDLDRGDGSTSGGFDSAFSLIEQKGDAPLTQDVSNVLGVDPQLGALGNNGGPTQTQLPAIASPAIDKGNAPARTATDQRGLARTVDVAAANASGGDGTDIGAVELPASAFPAPPGGGGDSGGTNNGGGGNNNGGGGTTKHRTDQPPIALIKKNHLANPNRLTVSGTAHDDHKVAKVEVAVVKKYKGRCRVLRESGHFSKRRRCGRTKTFLAADGTKKWSFKLKNELTRGYYVVYARATDNKGHVQTYAGPKSRRPFSVR